MNKVLIHIIILMFLFIQGGYTQKVTNALTFIGNNEIPISSRAQTVIKNDDGSYYIIVAVGRCDTLYMGTDTIVCQEFPDEYDFDKIGRRLYVAKVSPDLELDAYIRILGISLGGIEAELKFATNDSFLMMSYNFEGYQPKYSMFGDSLFYHDSLDRGGILKFDRNLNFIDRPIVSSKPIQEFILNDSLLIYLSNLGPDQERNEHYEVIKGDTLWNNSEYQEANGPFPSQTIYQNNLPFCVTYDLAQDTIVNYWKYSTLGTTYADEIELNSEGTLITSLFGAIDSFETVPDFYNITEHNLAGERLDTEVVTSRYYHLRVNEDDSYYGLTHFATAQATMFGDTFYNHYDSLGNIGNRRSLLVKFDEDGNHLWTYTMDALGDNTSLVSFSEGPTTVTSWWACWNIEVKLNDQYYPFKTRVYVMVILDKETGKELSHVYQHDDGTQVASVYYIENLEQEDKVRILAFLKFDEDVFGLAEDIDLNNGLIFMEGKLSFLTKVLTEPQDSDLALSILGNPIGSDGRLRFRYEGNSKLAYQVMDLNGRALLAGTTEKEGVHEIDLANIPAGAYVLSCSDKTSNGQSKIFIKN